MTIATILQLDRIERRIATLHTSLLIFQDYIMTTAAEMQTKIDALVAQSAIDRADAADAKADSARQATLSESAVSLLQGLTTIIADLRAQNGPVTPAQLDAMAAQVDAALANFAQSKADADAANAERDAADATLAAGVGANTPAP